jgi:hypothetical protein
MSKFDCKVSELNTAMKENKKDIKLSSIRENNSTSENENGNGNESISFFDNLVNEKHLKIVFLISVIHFILHSESVLEFLHSKIPSIMLNLNQLNSFGKLLVGLIIAIFLIIYTSFSIASS